MSFHRQPDFSVPRFLYEELELAGKVRSIRERMHPRAWMTDQGVPNEADPNPDETLFRIPLREPYHRRTRPRNYKRGDDDEEAILNQCDYRITLTALTEDTKGETIYVKQDALPTVYYGNHSAGILFWNAGNDPPAYGGAPFAVIAAVSQPLPNIPITFSAWWNWADNSGAAPTDTSLIQIINSGSCDIKINGTLVAPSFDLTQAGLARAPDGGAQNTFAGGTTFTITLP